jgi:hypothetical protein
MIIDSKDKAAFAEYETSLDVLEKALNLAGLKIRFNCFVAPLNNKMVDITRNKKRVKLVCIMEGDSPAQVVARVVGI